MSDPADVENFIRAELLQIEAAEQRRRDRFDAARSAMQGLLAQTQSRRLVQIVRRPWTVAEEIARESVICADALLAELEKGK